MTSKFRITSVLAIAALVSISICGTAQQQPVTQDASPTVTREQAEVILRELKALRLLLGKQPHLAEPVTPLLLLRAKVPDTGYVLGEATAPLTLVEFTDYQCSFCAQFQNDSFEKLRRTYVDTGKLRFVIRDLPLASHAFALKAAEAARCGGDQNKFWEMRGVLVAHFQDLKQESLLEYARQLNLDMTMFKHCMDSDKFLPEIQKDQADAGAAGISATPSFVLGKTEAGIVDGVRLVGALPYDSFSKEIAKQLMPPAQASGALMGKPQVEGTDGE